MLKGKAQTVRGSPRSLKYSLVTGVIRRPSSSCYKTCSSCATSPESFSTTGTKKSFFAIHFQHYSRTEVGDWLGLTSQRVGQIYNAALQQLETHPDYPFKLDN